MKKINVKGAIIPNGHQWIYDLFGIDATSPKKVNDALEDASGDDVEVHINSGGGSVFDGSEIYTDLREYQGDVTIKIVGIAASAASVIAMAGNKVMMSPTSQMMMHNAAVLAAGDYRDMEHTAEVLRNVNKTIANAYKMKSGLSDNELLKMMDKETWLTPQEALDLKLADEIMFESSDPHLVASSYQSGILPQEVIDKMMNEHLNNQIDGPSNDHDNESSNDQESDEDFLYIHNLRKRQLDLIHKEDE